MMTFIHHERSNTIRGQNAVNIDESDRQTDKSCRMIHTHGNMQASTYTKIKVLAAK